MPYDHAKFAQHAKELRGILGGEAAGLSDRAVVEHALKADERVITPETKQFLRDQYGESAASSFGKSFVRSTMLDTVGDLVGLGTSKYTETNPIQDDANSYARMGGGIIGMLALQALPGIGQAATGGRIGAAALRAALQAGAGANTNWREQEDQMAVGDRTAYSPGSTVLAAGTSGAGQLVGGGRWFQGKQDKAWDTGKELVKQAWKGGAPNRVGTAIKGTRALAKSPLMEAGANVGEELVQSVGERMLDDRNLTESGREARAPIPQRLLMTGGFGALADLGLNRGLLGKTVAARTPQPPPIKGVDIDADELDPNDVTALRDANPDELTDRPDVVEATEQGRPKAPYKVPFDEIVAERDSQVLRDAKKRAELEYGTVVMERMYEQAKRRSQTDEPDRYLFQRPDPNNPDYVVRMPVWRIGDQEFGYRASDGALLNVTRGVPGQSEDALDLRSQDIFQFLRGKNVMTRKPTAAIFPGGHHFLRGVNPIFEHGGQKYQIITHRPDPESGPEIRWVGGIPVSELDPKRRPGRLGVAPGHHFVQELELDTLQHRAEQQALKEILAEARARQKGTDKKPALTQEGLTPLGDEASRQKRANKAARGLVQHYSDIGGPAIDLTPPVDPDLPPPPRGTGGAGGSWPVPGPDSPGRGTPVKPLGEGKPSRKKPVKQLDPNQVPPTPDQGAIPIVPEGRFREEAEQMLVRAAEAMDEYRRRAGKKATTGEADAVYANALGIEGIQQALTEDLITTDEATYYAKLLRKK